MFFPQLPHCNKRLTIGIRHPIDTKYDHNTYRWLRPLNQATLQPMQLFVSRIMQIRVLYPSCLLPQMNTNGAKHETRFYFFAYHRGIHIKHLMLLEVDFTTSYLKDDNSNRMVRTCYYLIRVSGTSSCFHVVPKHDHYCLLYGSIAYHHQKERGCRFNILYMCFALLKLYNRVMFQTETISMK